MQEEGLGEDGESETEESLLDDSDDDPTFGIPEETRSKLSNMSLKKTRPRINVSEEEPETIEQKIPELDVKDRKCFEMVEKIIKDGQVEKLKLDQCKVYLRKYGLRLTGNKYVLMKRIKQHLELIEGGGEKKYPTSSFVLNCKGDACEGDVVMFEQNVYEIFSIASRSASDPPCGTRIVVGRIVKERYGAAKQQHTFTIEVLWSKGEIPLPPLYQLIIKGRNLYRLNTMRQRWADEEERRKVLQEKHMRGSLAQFSLENRIQQKEMMMSSAKRFNHPDPIAVSGRDPVSAYQNVGSSQQHASGVSQLPATSWPLHITSNEPVPSADAPPSYIPGILLPPQGYHPNREWNGYQVEVNPFFPPGRNVQHPPASNGPTKMFDDPLRQQVPVDEYPERPGQLECLYFMKHGDCKYRSACKYHHPKTHLSKASACTLNPQGLPLKPAPVNPFFLPGRNVQHPPASIPNGPTKTVDDPFRQLVPVEEYPERPGQLECQYFMKHGDCKFRSACKFHHPKTLLSRVSACALNPQGLPLKPDQPICTHYSRYGVCKFGPNCRFAHPVHHGSSAASSQI